MTTLAEARRAYEQKAWTAAYEGLSALDRATVLEPPDLERLAVAAFLIGQDDASRAALSRAYASFLDSGEPLRAAAAAFWLAFQNLDSPSQQAYAAGWLARARRLVDEHGRPCVEQGWLTCVSAFQRVNTGDFPGAHDEFAQAAATGAHFHNPDLTALARHGQGRALIALNRINDGCEMLDEAMVAVTAGEVGPIVAGVVYCSVISACHMLFDLARAQEWTLAFERWCAAQPDLVSFRGHCLLRRSEILQFHGAWDAALEEARRAHGRVEHAAADRDAALIAYQIAELMRLRGAADEAEDWYRRASQLGRNPQPGLALLRLAQGQTPAADAAIRLALRDTRDRRARVFVLIAAVEVLLAAGALDDAAAASAELSQLAAVTDTPFLRASAAQAAGAVALSRQQEDEALRWLGRAADLWRQLDAPYPLARTRLLVGQVYRTLRDREGSDLEFDAAEETFERLGATVDLRSLVELRGGAARDHGGGLTGREVEVLRLVATGATNRAIAARLRISEKTVARHISNIFTKLDLPSRAAATAYAYEHKLVAL